MEAQHHIGIPTRSTDAVPRPAYLAGGSPVGTVEIDKADAFLRHKNLFGCLPCEDILNYHSAQ